MMNNYGKLLHGKIKRSDIDEWKSIVDRIQARKDMEFLIMIMLIVYVCVGGAFGLSGIIYLSLGISSLKLYRLLVKHLIRIRNEPCK